MPPRGAGGGLLEVNAFIVGGLDPRPITGDPAVSWARCALDPRRSRRQLGTMRCRSHAIPTSFGHELLSIPDVPPAIWARRPFDPTRPGRRWGTMRVRSQAGPASCGREAR